MFQSFLQRPWMDSQVSHYMLWVTANSMAVQRALMYAGQRPDANGSLAALLRLGVPRDGVLWRRRRHAHDVHRVRGFGAFVHQRPGGRVYERPVQGHPPGPCPWHIQCRCATSMGFQPVHRISRAHNDSCHRRVTAADVWCCMGCRWPITVSKRLLYRGSDTTYIPMHGFPYVVDQSFHACLWERVMHVSPRSSEKSLRCSLSLQ